MHNQYLYVRVVVATLIATLIALKASEFMFEYSKSISINFPFNLQDSTPPPEWPKIPINFSDFDILVVGAGWSGAVIAERHATTYGHRTLVIDKRYHVGGNCYDYVDQETGILVSKYGAHLFHTNDDKVWHYVNRFGKWERWDHRVLAFINDKYVPVPVNINTVNALLNTSIKNSEEMAQWLENTQVHYPESPKNSEEMALSRVGPQLYDLIFRPYTRKQWNMSAAELEPEVTARIPIRDNLDDRYFSDRYQALPRHGYAKIFEAVLKHPLITVRLGVDYFDIKDEIGSNILHTYYTGPIDRFFETDERLEYRSLHFERIVISNHPGYFQPASVVNYPSLSVPYTRVVEYKHMLHQSSQHTILFREYSSDTGEAYYPVPTERNRRLYAKLVERTNSLLNITFVGRLANYKYFNMDEAIANALRTFEKFQHRPSPEPTDQYRVAAQCAVNSTEFLTSFLKAVGRPEAVAGLEEVFVEALQPLLSCQKCTSPMLYTISDKSYVGAVRHFRNQYRKFGISCAVMVALDSQTYDACLQNELPVFYWPTGGLRLGYVIGVAKAIFGLAGVRSHLNVLFSEMDVFWQKPPLEYIDMSVEHSFSVHSYHPECNLGFYFSRSTPGTIDFYRRIFTWMMKETEFDLHKPGGTDQKVFDFALRGEAQYTPRDFVYVRPANYTPLNHELFWHNMGENWVEGRHRQQAVTMHLTFGIGPSASRIEAAKRLGVFYGDA